MKACVETLVPDATSPVRQKILLGLNFYGNDYGLGDGSSIVGNQYVYSSYYARSLELQVVCCEWIPVECSVVNIVYKQPYTPEIMSLHIEYPSESLPTLGRNRDLTS